MEKLRFEEMNLSKELQRGISDMGFEEMSPIQSQAIPIILEGKDVIGQAQTGTGKTAAFGIPIIEKCNPADKSVQALVLCPTRELCIQVAEEIGKLAKHKRGLTVLPIYGGQPIDRQIRALKSGVTVVIGTPGRVIDHIKRKTLKIGNVSMMVLDEADEMFDMGFRDDIALVMNELREERQTIFFSATMASEIMKFAARYQVDPEIIKVVHKELTVPKVEQAYFELKQHMKTEILCRLIDMYNPKLSIVFCNTKKKVDELIEELQSRGYFADGLHGDLKQSQRDNVMGKFRKGTIDVLVATDVAARGIDVDDIDLVINYDMPQDEEYYVHRIGRTARAGREGKAFSFVSGRDIYKLRDIQRFTKTKIARKDLPTLKDIEANYTSSMLGKIKQEIDNEDLTKYEKIIESLLEEEYTSFDIAAALLKFYMVENRLDGHQELDMVDFGGQAKASASKSSNSRKSSGASTRVHINIGKRKGVSPRHILSALIEETGIEKKLVGTIDVYDKFTFVEIPGDYADDVLERLDGARIKGTKVKVEIANPKSK
ncbi:DEAD/DEAH box helicase [Tissierella sp.]|uniref:DEAD/DEAH box helicase n=1 Tax=Tissierella sp. TaxID=41274 RepID=UPI00285A908E|nr:DEAD/DEAH box helicase [Tissierella sp.]MDR7855362.1 DEAD/DEAH box helicase [Tissierella sp.]